MGDTQNRHNLTFTTEEWEDDCFPGVKYRMAKKWRETEDGDSGGREGDGGPEGPDIHSTDSDRYQFEESSWWCLYRGDGAHFLTISLPAVCQLNWMAGEWLHPRFVGALDTFLETIWVYFCLGREKLNRQHKGTTFLELISIRHSQWLSPMIHNKKQGY